MFLRCRKSEVDANVLFSVDYRSAAGLLRLWQLASTLKSKRSSLVTPRITSFTPPSAKGGTVVTLTGVSLSQTTKVTIGGKNAAFTIKSNTQVTATVPAGAKTGQKITITTAGGVVNSVATFIVLPSINSFTTTSGPVGTSVAIKGNAFTGTTSVTFGGIAATRYQVISDTEVDALVPTGAITGTIVVTTSGGTAASASRFTVTP